MVWKKNAISYLFWLVYAVLAGGGFILWMTEGVLHYTGMTQTMALITALSVLLAEAILVLVVHKLCKKGLCVQSGISGWLILEGTLAIGLLAAGVLLRIRDLAGVTTVSPYFEAAKVAEGQVIPQLVHGIEHMYLQLLHLMFLVFGNQYVVGIWCQIALQIIAAILLYCGIRKLAGVIPALMSAAFFMISTVMRAEAMVLSSRNLFLVLFSLGLLVIVELLSNRQRSPIACLLSGLMAAIVCYFDLSGSVLLLLAFGLLFAQREKPWKKRNTLPVSILMLVLGTAIGVLTSFGLDALSTGKNILRIIQAWWEVFTPDMFILEMPAWTQIGVLDTTILLGGMCLMIFSFWCNKKQEQLSIWLPMLLGILALQSFGMLTPEQDGCNLLYLFGAVCVGLGMSGAVGITSESMITAEKSDAQNTEEPPAEPAEGSATNNKTKAADLEMIQLEKSENTDQLEPIEYIENPLPLPKKHVKRVLDYGLQTKEMDDFDFPVSDDDDFDL